MTLDPLQGFGSRRALRTKKAPHNAALHDTKICCILFIAASVRLHQESMMASRLFSLSRNARQKTNIGSTATEMHLTTIYKGSPSSAYALISGRLGRARIPQVSMIGRDERTITTGQPGTLAGPLGRCYFCSDGTFDAPGGWQRNCTATVRRFRRHGQGCTGCCVVSLFFVGDACQASAAR